MVEGRSGAGAAMIDTLDAAGIGNDVVTPGRVPALDELTRYASIVLVDVDRRDLSDGQVEALTAAVRDLGRGMVVVGGMHSYALGGYRDSALEEILPVISEITDPLRRQTVAEVLAIDSSGSMGACHCNEEGQNGMGGGNRIDGGVSKTAIARNAAARAIAALEATDEVGLLSMDANDSWLLDLQASPSQEDIDSGLEQIVPDGPTFLDTGLLTAADALRASDASLKHIIFFSDGFTEPGSLAAVADQAAELYAEGITVSVVATGEGAAEDLRPIAEAGGGRFYPGKNLDQIPELIVQEAVIASRDFVNEGEFLPLIASSAPTVRNLTQSPVLQGYLATTAKPTARVDLRIGPDEDPLLASWQAGLGRVAAWTSDGGERWSAPWSAWSGAPDFWAGVVKDTFPVVGDGGGIVAKVVDGQLELRLEGAEDWPTDGVANASIAGPDGTSTIVPLERIDGSTFAATVPVTDAGTYAVGATVSDGGETVWSGIGLTTRSYPAEYAPRPTDRAQLERVAARTGGRIDPAPSDLFSPDGTVAGRRRIDLTPWLLLFALLAWPVAVA
ncbi:MAG: glutamine amidotransferase [Acidimicrobiales bacterium]